MRKIKRHLSYPLLICLFLSTSFTINGQKVSGKADPETLRLIQEATAEKGKETGAVIILKDYQMTINEKGQTRLVLRILGKVFTKEAMSDYNQIPLGYNSYYEEPSLDYARVIHNDGSIREVPKDAVQIKTTPESEGLQYTDSRYLSFALSGMEIGAAFDYQLTFTQKMPIVEGEWYDNHMFVNLLRSLSPPYIPRIDPTLTSKYTLLVPKGSKFQYHLYYGNAVPVKSNIGSQDEYQWVLTNLPSLKMEEAMPPLSTLTPILVLSSIDSWQKIDQWAFKKLSPKVEITDEIRTKATRLTSGENSNREKIKVISDFIQREIEYIYSDLDRGGYTPHPAGEIFKSRYGDCKDKSILLISMLKAVGIEAFPALLTPFPYDELYDVPTPLFTHMITCVPDSGRNIWLDMTSGVTPFPDLYFPDQGRMAFIIDGKGGRLTRTPAYDESKNVSDYLLDASFSGGKAQINMEITSSGVQCDILKSVFKGMPADMREQSLKMMIQSYAKNAGFDSIRISDLNNPDIPFRADLRYTIDSVWQKGQQEFSFGSHTLLPLSLLGNVEAQPSPAKRYNDFNAGYSYKVRGSERYEPPVKDLLPVNIPHRDSVKNDFFEYSQTFTGEGGAITAKWSFVNKNAVIPAEKYESYTEGLKSLREMISWNLTYVDPLSFIPSVIKSENPNKILSYCNELLKNDPHNILAFLLRGAVYNSSGQIDPALRVFREVIKIAPDNKYPYLYIVYPLISKGNLTLALENLGEAISLDHEFETALLTRSMIYSDQKLFDKALADLNQVLKINPHNAFYHQDKYNLLKKMGKETEALTFLEEAYKRDSTNDVLCSVLGEAYLSKDLYTKAIEIYYRAIRLDETKSINYGNLGWAYYKANNDQKSIEYSRKAIEIDPVAYYAIYNLGLANLRSGNINEARKIYSELKNEEHSITERVKKSAIQDLYDLRSTGVYGKEIKAILKDFFGI